MKRKIIRIDEEKCNGCGECIPDCSEGALKIVDGKIKLVSEGLCDGLGACVGRCPIGALVVEEREAEEFNEEKAGENIQKVQREKYQGCPGMKMVDFRDNKEVKEKHRRSGLRQWPVQLKLLNPSALYFKNADLIVVADCVPFTYSNFHSRFLKGKILIVFCPKLDSANEEYVEKLSKILDINSINSITIVYMEVPCCNGTTQILQEALERAKKNILVKNYTISLQGEIM